MDYKLDPYEIEEIEYCIPQIEQMYQFKFDDGELESVKNFEEFCDLIIEKVNLENVETCTSQQAFYKLRDSLIKTKLIEKENFRVDTELKTIFPRKDRKKLVALVENEIKLKFNIIKAPDFITISLLVLGIISFILLFFYFIIGFLGIATSIFGFYLCKWFGNELELKTVKELVEKITTENYLAVRTDKNTINKSELKKILTDLVSENSGIEKEKLKTASFI